MADPVQTSYDVIIGLEVHVQLATQTKIFCGCPTKFGSSPNTQVCPVCTGLPGSLPVLNRTAFDLGLRAVLAMNGSVSKKIKFDRKNYFYPDLPKNYQISQYDMPLGSGGYIEIAASGGTKRIHITRAHLEEDAGKLIHDADAVSSLVDFNRAGTPLLEIVSEPEIKSPEDAYAYLTVLKALIKCIGASDVNMDKGHLRCDANISLRKSANDPFGSKVEIKNVNSFKNVRSALRYEIKRQSEQLDAGEAVRQETRLFDADSGKTARLRSKEEAHDYRYFPEPDLVPFLIDEEYLDTIQKNMPSLPKERKNMFQSKFGLNDYDTNLLLSDSDLTDLFEELARGYHQYKTLANWIIGPLFAHLNESDIRLADLGLSPARFLDMIRLVDDGKISFKACKEHVFPEFIKTAEEPEKILKDKNLGQISNMDELDKAVDAVIADHSKSVNDFRQGKEQAFMFLVGQVMRQTKGKANPNKVNQLIREKLKK